MCQIIFQNEERDKLFNERLQEKLKLDLNSKKNQCRKNIDGIGSEMKIFGKSLEKYNHRIDPKEKYREHFNELLMHYWLKRDYDRFNKKSTPKTKYYDSYYDSPPINENTENNKMNK